LLDYSERQLAQDRFVAEREGYEIELVKADMTQRFTFGDEHFDVIFHPWSNNYVEDVYHIWRECYRVLRRGGVLIAQMSNGLYFLFDDIQNEPLTLKYKLPWNPLKMPQEKFRQMAENLEGLEFSHTLDENIGGQLKAGFTLTNIEERRDPPGSCVLREYTSQSYVTRAVKL
jgi:ubiquinone/menaquinone biosynthesis C-methylase UbiE